jgi:hypothetical protein
MYAILIAPTTLILVLSFGIPKSGQWLASKGKIVDAEKALRELLVRVPPYPSDINLASVANIKPQNKVGIARIFSKQYRRATILASVPWFLMDLSIFGIGIFTPIILTLALGTHNPHARNIAELIANDRMGVRGALLIDIFTVLGSFIAIYMITKWSRIKLQTIGLIVSGFGLLMATLSLGFDGNTKTILMVCGFILFNFMIHAGPLSTVYLISGEVYPIEIRGIGAGFSASFAKLGAVLASFLFPIYLKDIGLESLLCFLVFTCFLAAYVSWHFRIDTTDIDISKLDQ